MFDPTEETNDPEKTGVSDEPKDEPVEEEVEEEEADGTTDTVDEE